MLVPHLAVMAFATISSASAALYPTYPVDHTIYRPGPGQVTWRDDEFEPHLKNIGPLRIDLYTEDVFIRTLARNVNPASRRHTVTIPPNLESNGSNFMMCFKFPQPPYEVYTANFAITNTTRSAVSDLANNDTAESNVTEAPSFITLVLPNTTIVSSLPPTQSRQFAASATVYANLPRKGRGRNGVNASAARSSRIDLEKVKFRIVFILWPALVGTLMAL